MKMKRPMPATPERGAARVFAMGLYLLSFSAVPSVHAETQPEAPPPSAAVPPPAAVPSGPGTPGIGVPSEPPTVSPALKLPTVEPAKEPSAAPTPPLPTAPTEGGNFPALRTGSSDATPPSADVATAPLPPFEGAESASTGHGSGHDQPVIENWWSWDYGPGKPHHHPPFGFALINFAVFLLIMARLFGKSFSDFLRTRHTDVRRAIDRAREAQEHAEKHLRQIEERTRSLEAEIAEMLANFRRQAEAERQTIVQRAEAEAAGLLRDAEAQAQAAIAAAKRSLEQKAALLAVDLAEKLVRSRLNEDDQRRLSERYISDIESLSHANATKATASAKEST